jgi:hypothetical protein
LIFTIAFATLQKTKILGEDKKNFNVIVALIIGLITIVPHWTGRYPAGYDVVTIINQTLPDVSLIAIGVILFLLIAGILGSESAWMNSSISGFLSLFAFVAVVIIFASRLGLWVDLDRLIDPDTQALLLIILVAALIIGFITKEPKGGGVGDLGKGLKGLGEFFGKGR